MSAGRYGAVAGVAALLAAVLLVAPAAAQFEDERKAVKLPEPMKQHMLSNMREHLLALHEIQVALGREDLDRAAEIAESRLGTSSLTEHGAEHMAPHMPPAMRAMGEAMHRAASEFALTAQEGEIYRAVGALARVTRQCVGCHATYRLE